MRSILNNAEKKQILRPKFEHVYGQNSHVLTRASKNNFNKLQ